MRNSETGTYGSSTQINHQISNFTQRSREWYEYINKVIIEEEELGRRLAEEMGFDQHIRCSAIHLYGWRLDQFYEMLPQIREYANVVEENAEAISAFLPPEVQFVFYLDAENRNMTCKVHAIITGNQEARQEKLAEWKDADVLITSYDLLKRDVHLYEDMEFEYEVIDEAQYIKNHSTAAAKAVKVIKSRNRFALTSTPIENRLSELWSIFDYLMPGFLYGYDVFKRELETPIAKNGDEDAMKRLQRMTGPFILRRLKKDVLKDLPDKLEEIRYVQLEELGIAYYKITGATPKEKRLQMVKDFNEDTTPLFLISLKAGGVGLNLTGADVVIHYDPWWNVAAQEQATDRAHRIGQTRKVTVYKMIARNTVEEKILKLQETKRDLADSIMNAQTGQLAGLSKEDLLQLLEA